MHRPFYVLFVLLETLAGFLFLVRSMHADDLDTAGGGMRGGVIIVAWTLDDACNEDLYGVCQGIEDPVALSNFDNENHVATTQEVERLPWCPARSGQPTGFELLGTGYDSAYDFAMFDGRYMDVVPSHSRFDETSSSVAIVLLSGPATSLYFEDAEGRLHGGSVLPVDTCPSPGDAAVDVRNALASRPVEAEGVGEAPASWKVCLAQLQPAAAAWESLVAAAEQTRDVAAVVWHSMLTTNIARHSSAVPLAADEEVLSYPVGLRGDLAQAEDYREEVALIRAAQVLDQLSLRLQEAAQHLRYMAADRIVAKGGNRRVAQRAD